MKLTKGMLVFLAGVVNICIFGYFTNWQAAVSMFVALWLLNIDNERE